MTRRVLVDAEALEILLDGPEGSRYLEARRVARAALDAAYDAEHGVPDEPCEFCGDGPCLNDDAAPGATRTIDTVSWQNPVYAIAADEAIRQLDGMTADRDHLSALLDEALEALDEIGCGRCCAEMTAAAARIRAQTGHPTAQAKFEGFEDAPDAKGDQ